MFPKYSGSKFVIAQVKVHLLQLLKGSKLKYSKIPLLRALKKKKKKKIKNKKKKRERTLRY